MANAENHPGAFGTGRLDYAILPVLSNVEEVGVLPFDHIKPLTSLRFYAASAIVIFHSTNYWTWASPFRGLPLDQGVSFFFVLSGFILTHVYSGRTTTFGQFIWARVARLWPVHLVTLLMVLLFIRPDSQQLPGSGWFSPWLALVVNSILAHSLVPFQLYTFSWNSVSWSISTEMGFYLAFPFLFVRLRLNWPIILVAAFMLIVFYQVLVSMLALPEDTTFDALGARFLVYASPLARGFEFVLGMSTYILSQRWREVQVGSGMVSLAELGCLVLLAAWYGSAWLIAPPFVTLFVFQDWMEFAGSCFVFAILIGVYSRGDGVLSKALSLSPCIWLGQISFALYMVHQVLMKWIFLAQLEGRLAPQGPLIVLAACIGVAALLHHLVERPARSLLMKLSQPRARVDRPRSDDAAMT